MEALEHATSSIAGLLSDSGIKPTSQRILVAGILLEKPQHLSADQVMGSIRRQGGNVSRATVYNTLNLMVNHGLVRTVSVEPGKVFYDSNTSAHFHFYNEDSGLLSDFPQDQVRIAALPVPPANTRAIGIDVIVRVRNGA